MKNKTLRTITFLSGLILLISGISPVLSQTLELEIQAGGYKLQGPTTITLTPVQSTFSTLTESTINFRDITIEDIDTKSTTTGGLTIIDEMGGIRSDSNQKTTEAFLVQVSATQMAKNNNGTLANCTTTPKECIPTANFLIQNKDMDANSNNDKETIYGSPEDLNLVITTNTFTSLDQTRTLAAGTGTTPGTWTIFPTLKVIVPQGQSPGNYQSTLTFTII